MKKRHLVAHVLIHVLLHNAVNDVNASKMETSEARLKFQKINRVPDTSIISSTCTAKSRLECSYICARERIQSLYYMQTSKTCHCNHGIDARVNNDATDTVIYGQVEFIFQNSHPGEHNDYVWPPQQDCLEFYRLGYRRDGVYTIRPMGGADVVTWCDMTNGGWTVFQRRQDGSVDFYRNWVDYSAGFGDISGDFWLGLENIHLLTIEPSELYIFMEAFGDKSPSSAWAHYSSFSVGDASSLYRLTVSGFQGDCGDAFSHHSGMAFSTKDNENDLHVSDDCAEEYKGAWWYNKCMHSNLNGQYLGGYQSSFGDGIHWYWCWGFYYSLKKTELKIRRI